MDIKHILAGNVRAYRKALGLTQTELGGSSGIGRSAIGCIERCKANPTLEKIRKIAKALGIDPVLLLIKPARDKSVLFTGEFSQYALCFFEDDDIRFEPLDYDNGDISTIVLRMLVSRGYSEEDLLEEYEAVYPQIYALFEGHEPSE